MSAPTSPFAHTVPTTPTPEYILYLTPFCASFSTHWLLVHLEQTLSIKYTPRTISFSSRQQRSEEYLRVNPKGRIPAMLICDDVDDDDEGGGEGGAGREGIAYTESSALIQILAERHPQVHLFPSPAAKGRARYTYIELTTYITNTLLPALRDHFYAAKDGPGDDSSAGIIRDLADKRLSEFWSTLNTLLQGKAYLLGESISAADFLAGGTIAWHVDIERMARGGGADVNAWVDRLQGREDWREVVRREQELERGMAA